MELKRFQISFRDYSQPTLRGMLLAPIAWLAIFYLAVCLLLPVWGLKWLCRWFPALQRRIASSCASPRTWLRLAVLPLLWIAGLFVGVLCVTLFIYTLFWPPLFLKLLAKTGDCILVTAGSVIFYSAFEQAAVQVPRNWPLLKGNRGKHFVILGNERNEFGSVIPVCVARFPEGLADGLNLTVESPGRRLGQEIYAKGRLLDEQIRRAAR